MAIVGAVLYFFLYDQSSVNRRQNNIWLRLHLLRADFYATVLVRDDMIRVGEHSTLRQLQLKPLEAIGCQAAYPGRRDSHEFILTFAKQATDNLVTALDIAKRLLDYNQHAPAIYFPLLMPECFLIGPTETKKATGDFIGALAKILEEANTNSETVTEAPSTQPVRRLDEVKAVEESDLVWSE